MEGLVRFPLPGIAANDGVAGPARGASAAGETQNTEGYETERSFEHATHPKPHQWDGDKIKITTT